MLAILAPVGKYRLSFVFIFFGFLGLVNHEAHAATTTATSTLHDSAVVESRVREVFAYAPVMVEIARCESKFRQFTDAGTVLRSGVS